MDKVFSQLEVCVVTAFEFLFMVVVAFKVVESDCLISITVYTIRDPGGDEFVIFG